MASNVLNSFRDHHSDDQILWSAYDIRALVPETFELKHHRFEAGRYELDFADRSPAYHFVSLGTRFRFAEQTGPGAVCQISCRVSVEAEPVAGKMDGCDTVEWSASPASNWGRWLSRFKGKASYHWLGLWHLEAKNRILGVLAEGKKPLDTELLDGICTHYESI